MTRPRGWIYTTSRDMTPPELKLPLLGVRLCPPRAAWCQESVPRLCPGACLKRRGTGDHLAPGSGIYRASVDTVQ